MPSMDFSTGSRSAIRKNRVSDARYQIWLCRCRWRGMRPRILTLSTSSAFAFSSGSAASWKMTAATLIAAAVSRIGRLTR